MPVSFAQFEFPVFVLAFVANIILLIVVFQYAQRNRSRVLFSLFVIAQAAWITINYFAFSGNSSQFLWLARFTMFAATLHALAFFFFVYFFRDEDERMKRWYLFAIIIIGAIVAAITLSPYLFTSLAPDAHGVLSPQAGPAIPMFGIFIALCIGAGFYRILRQFLKATGVERAQWRFLAIGLTITFLLVVGFSFVNFIVLGNISSVRYGHLYTLPFIIFTAYAMVRHSLLNVKTIIAEVAVISLIFLLGLQLSSAATPSQIFVNVLVLLGTIIVGTLLIKGVMREVEQRQKLQVLTKQLETANTQLKVLDQARSEFISIASHQLRTPPATIKWYLSSVLAGDYGKFDPETKIALEKVEITNNSLISLIDDLLNVSRIERGTMEFLFEETDVQAITQLTVDQLQPQAIMKKLSIEFQKPETPLPLIMADKEKLRQVFNNLIDNAIKYTTQGVVRVSIALEADSIVVRVSDNGKGIAPDQLVSIFEKFKRGKESAMHATGLGLGLYVAKIIMAQHKGRIWAESPGEGRGSTFACSLPVHSGLKETTLLDLSAPPVTNNTTKA